MLSWSDLPEATESCRDRFGQLVGVVKHEYRGNVDENKQRSQKDEQNRNI